MRGIVKNYSFGMKKEYQPMIIKVDTTLSGYSDSNTIVLRMSASSTRYNICTIDWGDGEYTNHDSRPAEASVFVTHTYQTAGEKIIKLYGMVNFEFNNSSSSDKNKLISIIDFGSVDANNNQENSFYGCVNLESLPTKAKLLNRITNSHAMFSGCVKLTSLPDDCTLENLVVGGRSNTGGGMFNGCKLTHLPIGINLEKLTTGYSMFQNNNISHIPTGVKLNSLTIGGYMFTSNNLTDLGNLELLSITNADSMFRGTSNSGITSLPETMVLDNLVNGAGMFNGCKLTHLPVNMKLDNLVTGGTGNSNGSMFQNNNLVDLPLGITFKSLNAGVGIFLNQTLNTIRYSQLLIDMEANNINLDVNFHAGSSKYNSSAQTARDNLVARGWTITDGGIV